MTGNEIEALSALPWMTSRIGKNLGILRGGSLEGGKLVKELQLQEMHAE